MYTSLRRLAVPLLAGALLLGACSDGGGEEEAAENPEQAFSEALDALSEYEGVTLELTLQADPADLTGADTPEQAAEALVNSSLTISAKGESAEDSQAEVVVNVDGNEDAFEVRAVDQSIYARADVAELVETFGGDPAQVEAFAQQATAQGFDFAQPLVDGEWVGVEGVDELAEQFGVPQQTPDPEQAARVADEIVRVLEQNVSVTSEGTDDVGAHLVLGVPLRETLQDLVQTLQSVGGPAAGALPTDDLAEVPDAEVPVDVWVSDGRLVQVEMDFVAIAEAAGEEPPEDVDELALRATLDEFTEDVEAPDDFVEIDVEQILETFFGGAFGGIDSSDSMELGASGGREVVVPELGVACSDLEMLSPGEVESFLEASGTPGALKAVKQNCPELF